MVSPQRVVLVTGASSGIGRATATLLAESGYRVFGTSRDGQGPAGAPYEMLQLELASDASVRRCVDAVLERAGRIDVLFNNAGFGVVGAVEEITGKQAQAQLEVFLFGVHRMVRAVLPIMRAQRSGYVVNMSSAGSTMAFPFGGLYSAGKQAMAGYTESLRREVRGFGIAVSYLEATFIRTEAADDAVIADPIGAYGPWRDRAVRTFQRRIRRGKRPEIIAEAVRDLIETPDPLLIRRVDAQAKVLPVVRALTPQRTWDLLFDTYRRLAGGTSGATTPGQAPRRRRLTGRG